MSLAKKIPKGHYIQWLITFNPWAHCWLKSRLKKISARLKTVGEFVCKCCFQQFSRTKTWNADFDFAGAGSESTIKAESDFSSGLGFELEGATVDNNGLIVLGDVAQTSS